MQLALIFSCPMNSLPFDSRTLWSTKSSLTVRCSNHQLSTTILDGWYEVFLLKCCVGFYQKCCCALWVNNLISTAAVHRNVICVDGLAVRRGGSLQKVNSRSCCACLGHTTCGCLSLDRSTNPPNPMDPGLSVRSFWQGLGSQV